MLLITLNCPNWEKNEKIKKRLAKKNFHAINAVYGQFIQKG